MLFVSFLVQTTLSNNDNSKTLQVLTDILSQNWCLSHQISTTTQRLHSYKFALVDKAFLSTAQPGWVEQALKSTWQKLDSILRYAESSQGFTEIKQVRTDSIWLQWYQCLEHFCSEGRTSLHCQEVRGIPGYGWTHFSMPRKLQVADCSRQPKYMFSFSAANYSLKASVHGIRQFH